MPPLQYWLQRGHAFSGVETAGDLMGFLLGHMPLQRGHAFSGVETALKYQRPDNQNQSFKGATPSQAWRPCSRQANPGGCSARFKGATPSQAWRQLLCRRFLPSREVTTTTPRATSVVSIAKKARGASRSLSAGALGFLRLAGNS